MITSQCLICKNFWGDGLCEAYQNGIPKEIFIGEVDHTEPYKGDNGIMFERVD